MDNLIRENQENNRNANLSEIAVPKEIKKKNEKTK